MTPGSSNEGHTKQLMGGLVSNRLFTLDSPPYIVALFAAVDPHRHKSWWSTNLVLMHNLQIYMFLIAGAVHSKTTSQPSEFSPVWYIKIFGGFRVAWGQLNDTSPQPWLRREV
ncbi:predicted protein [Coccidioides posadasii str. Silveira]|uniref:Predicted protein n=2 Tax=Coccidioides posadasii TaxID=199306 RepID=E9CZ09_COCPS|nr:predicted protein [Coccidioides posadasii str. Silveira]KMM72978.1 hypothetical protein CPAG_09268 [Coccidioides posadasii RMSCC 3488]